MISKIATIRGTRLALLTASQWCYAAAGVLGFLLMHFRFSPETRKNILLRHGVVNRIPYDIGFGLLILLIALPTVSFLDGAFEYVLSTLLVLELPNQVAVQYLLDSRSELFSYYTMIFVAIVIAPLIEEYLFRGLFQTYMRSFLGPRGGILITSLLFSLFHFSMHQKIANFPLLVSLFIFALYLGFCYEKRESLVSPVALHMAFNATSVLRMHFFEG